jgi:small subunit ribosomal protein S2
LITKAIADAIVEARQSAPTREEVEEGEGQTTYSSDRGSEPAEEGDRRRRRRPRRRRAKPEAIAARLKTTGEGAEGAEAAEEGE